MPKYLKRCHREEAEANFFSFYLRLQRVEVAGKQCCCRRKRRLAAPAGCMLGGLTKSPSHPHPWYLLTSTHDVSLQERPHLLQSDSSVPGRGGEAGALWKEGMGPALRGCFLVLSYNSTHFQVSFQPQWELWFHFIV